MVEELEWQTRRDRINKKLKTLKPAWKIIKHWEGLDTSTLDHYAVEEYPTANGPADYALFVKGKLLGIIEAKKVRLARRMFWNRQNATQKALLTGRETGMVTGFPSFMRQMVKSSGISISETRKISHVK